MPAQLACGYFVVSCMRQLGNTFSGLAQDSIYIVSFFIDREKNLGKVAIEPRYSQKRRLVDSPQRNPVSQVGSWSFVV